MTDLAKLPANVAALIHERDCLRTQKQLLTAELEMTARYLERISVIAAGSVRHDMQERIAGIRVTIKATNP